MVGSYAHEFAQHELVGRGGFGTVHRCTHALDGTEYAMKKVLLSSNIREHVRLQKVRREVTILAKLSHQHIVRYYQVPTLLL